MEGVSNSCVARLRRWKGKEKREEEEKKKSMPPVSSAASEKPRLSRTPRAFICTQEYPVGNEGTRIQRHDSVENTGYGRWLEQKRGEAVESERGDASFDVHCSPSSGLFLRGKIRGITE